MHTAIQHQSDQTT